MRVHDHLSRDALHQRPVTTLALEALAKRAALELLDVARRDTASDKDTVAGAETQREIAGHLAEDREKLVDFCHVLLNSNEFLYVE